MVPMMALSQKVRIALRIVVVLTLHWLSTACSGLSRTLMILGGV